MASSMRTSAQRVIGAARTARDRLLLSILLAGGLRIGEALGLRREDMHLLPDATHLGCAHRCAHLHVRPRQDNVNGARAKGGRSRVVPLVQDCVHRYRDHLAERDQIRGAAGSDFVFVNVTGPFARGRCRTPTPSRSLSGSATGAVFAPVRT
ncbi:tyrosine-type recombinase/integrase [Nonomuraea sp. AD125B]|uniref:tyrosine-type recombinase/integrase n=1 Tax=Nonomuraea sp. AD125B TaxID=3242897 RepID=UPI00352860BF